MYIQYLGHSCFYFNSIKRIKLVVDPYGKDIPYKFPEITADVVIISHEHYDHNACHRVRGNPKVVKRTSDFFVEHEIYLEGRKYPLVFKGVPTFHDNVLGKRKGPNTIFCWNMEGLNFCHMGDLGHLLNDEQLKQIPRPDILFIPVGGRITLTSSEAALVINQLKPYIIFPMHYMTKYIEGKNLADEEVESFLEKMQEVDRLNTNGIEIDMEKLLPEGKSKVILLAYE